MAEFLRDNDENAKPNRANSILKGAAMSVSEKSAALVPTLRTHLPTPMFQT